MPSRHLAVLAAAPVVLVACSSDGSPEEASTTTAAPEPVGPVPVIEPLTGGNGVFIGSVAGPELEDAGWVEEEFAVSGTATSYAADGDLPADGAYELHEDQRAEYRTRVLVRRPAEPPDFRGTVVVEWLNVSGGLDAGPDFSYLGDELLRGGYAWVGVSAQLIGIEGGSVAVSVSAGAGQAGQGLKGLDPERYGSLSHPGDAFSYDILTQVGRAVQAADEDLLGGLAPDVVLAVGESQSAFALTTYANGVQPRAGAFDGFLIHSRGAAAFPLGEAGTAMDIAGSIGRPPTRIRTDLDVPVLMLETETDVGGFLNYQAARQPDTDLIRTWEVAGAAHADAFLLGPIADSLECPLPINDGPHHYVAKAALRHLDAWVRDGEAPPRAEPLATDASGALVRDADGIATGGIRTPLVDVPVAVLSGATAPGGSIACALFGSTVPLPPERLAARYGSVDEYLAAYRDAAEAAVEAGFVLEDDLETLLDHADPAALAADLS